MRFVGTFCGNFRGNYAGALRELCGNFVGTTPENGLKMRYFHAKSGNIFLAQKHEKIPRCVIFKHLGIFTKVETGGLEPKCPYVDLCKNPVDTCF